MDETDMEMSPGNWADPAKQITDRLTRAVIHETLRHAFRSHIGADPGDKESRILTLQRTMLEDVLPDQFDSTADVMEKVSYGLTRMILLAHRDERFKSILDLGWHSAIIITQWADKDKDGAARELARYLDEDDEDVGPRPTRRRYQAAMAALGSTDDDGLSSRPTRPRPINKLTFDMVARDGYAELPRLLETFKSFDFSRHVAHVIAVELPRLALEGKAAEINLIADRLAEDESPAKYVKPVSVFLVRHGMHKTHEAKTALLRLQDLPADPTAYEWLFKQFELMVPRKQLVKMTPDKKAWKAHPRWSKVPQHRAADYGRRLFERNFYEWCMAIEEFNDPDNHPLNFIEYDKRYARRRTPII